MMAGAGPRRRALDPHRGRDHRPALGHGGRLMASAESVAAVIEAGGAHVPELMERLEARLQELARSHGAVLAEHAGSDDRRRRQAAAAAAGVRGGGRRAARRRRRAARRGRGGAGALGHAGPRRRARRGAAAARAADGRGTAGREMATATGDLLFSRAFAELAAGGRAEAVRVLSDASSRARAGRAAAARGRVEHRRSRRERYLARCDLKTARLFEAACRLGAQAGGGSEDAARALRPRHRPGVPAARRRARRLRAGRAHRQAPRHRPARRHGHAPADPRHGARSGAGSARPAGRAHAGRGRGGVRRDRRHAVRWRPRGRRRWRWSRPRRRRCRRCRRPSRERSSWWPTASSTGT